MTVFPKTPALSAAPVGKSPDLADGRLAQTTADSAAVHAAPERKKRNRYHHGNLRQALIDQAVVTIRERGVAQLTLRDVGAQLRVSRTALYRHFADKTALLAAVATQGFRTFRLALIHSWESGGHGRAGFLAQGEAYLRFALDNPSHYRVMFGGFMEHAACDPGLATEAEAAFAVLVQALTELQQQRLVRDGDVQMLAVFVWSSVHGAAMLAIDGQLAGMRVEPLMTSTVARVWDAVAAR